MRKCASRQAGLAEDFQFCGRFLAESWTFELFLFEFLVAFDLFAENMFRFQSACLKFTLGMRKTYEIMVKIGAFVRKFSKTQNLACGRIFTFLMSACMYTCQGCCVAGFSRGQSS